MIKNGSLNQDDELEPEVKEAACAGERSRANAAVDTLRPTANPEVK